MKLLKVIMVALASLGASAPQLTAGSINKELEGWYCAAAWRATWEQFSEWSNSIEQIELQEALDEVVCNIGNTDLNQEIPGNLLQLAVRGNNNYRKFVEEISEYLLGTVTNPLNDPNRRRIFVSLILGEENGDNLFHWMRVWYPNVPGKNRGYKHVVRYLCLNIEGLRIEELYAIRSNECGTPPFDFLDQ